VIGTRVRLIMEMINENSTGYRFNVLTAAK